MGDHVLIDHDGRLEARVPAVAAAITASSPFGVRMTKEVLWAQLAMQTFLTRQPVRWQNR
jgi:hypothetical protein